MDYLKRATIKNYTAWDLNCPQIVRVHNRKNLEKIFKRSARRFMKQDLNKKKEDCKMYTLFFEDSMEPVLNTNWGSPTFESLDEVESYLNSAYTTVICDMDSEESTVYACTDVNGVESYIVAIAN